MEDLEEHYERVVASDQFSKLYDGATLGDYLPIDPDVPSLGWPNAGFLLWLDAVEAVRLEKESP